MIQRRQAQSVFMPRAEAARCRDRAEKAKTPERATRWRHVAEDYLRVRSGVGGS